LSPARVGIENDFLEGGRAKEKELGISDEILVVGKDRKVAWTEKFGLLGVADPEKSLARQFEEKFRLVAPVQRVSLVIVDAVDRELGSPAQEMLFRPEVVPGVESDIVNIGLRSGSRRCGRCSEDRR